MSCITEILKLKGDKEFLSIPSQKEGEINRGVVIEDGGIYKDYEFMITFNDMGFRCGYVAVPSTHPAYNDPSDYPDYNVHGGITFFDEGHLVKPLLGHTCTDKWLGFDCGHAGDLADLENAKYYFKDDKLVSIRIDSLIEINKEVEKEMISKFPDYLKFKYCSIHGDILRTKEYVAEQCHNLIDQLIEKAA